MSNRLTQSRWRPATILALLALLLLGSAARASAATTGQVRSDAEWILAAQLPDGAIANYVDRKAIWPYLGNYAAVGLARAAQITHDRRYSDAAWSWLRWYQAHQDSSGFVTDYQVTAGVETSTGAMDSTDAYAGTFLFAARATWQATHDRAQLRGLAPGIAAAVSAIEATQDSDGLTWAKPTWHVKYLMDESEAYAGLQAATGLASTLGQPVLEASAATAAARLRSGTAHLWNPDLGAYNWALHADGVSQPTNWSVLYPDALEQAWPVAFGLVSGARAQSLMGHFAAAQPNWDLPTAVASFGSGPSPVGYWAVPAWAFARIGNLAVAQAALGSIRTSALAVGRAWPFTPSDAGQLLALADVGSAGAAWLS
ncbi:MAG TPA: hypothetical protein VG294_15635 [Solirubrobacteraceae bacterium]|nr:hypothetical protein [Solirubrobacteraceae bacterium]